MDKTIQKAIKYPQIASYMSIIFSLYLLILGLGAVVVVTLLSFIPPYYARDIYKFGYLRTLLEQRKVIFSFVKRYVPTNFGKIDATALIVLGSAWFMITVFLAMKRRYGQKLQRLTFKKDFEALKTSLHLSDDAAVLAPCKDKLDALHVSSKKDREELLKLFAETKKKLESMGRTLSFLSIDVVESTKMKQGEEKASIELDFREYKRFVEAKLAAQGVMKSTWTPDGVMCCFPAVDTAVRAARDIISGLEAFNKNVKTMKQDFKVRCGINSGYVYYDESVPMEEMSDHVIDVAGHMQKYAAPNAIYIAKPSIEPLEERNGFMPASRAVDGYEVYEWKQQDRS